MEETYQGLQHHPRMRREERAKQFMPFAAVKGYEEALRKMEAEVETGAAGEPLRIKWDEETNEPMDES